MMRVWSRFSTPFEAFADDSHDFLLLSDEFGQGLEMVRKFRILTNRARFLQPVGFLMVFLC